MAKRKLIIANWKMNPETPREAKALYLATKKQAQKYRDHDVVVCSPVIFLGFFNHRPVKNFSLGVQDVASEKGPGAYTGKVSARQAQYAGATYALVGHSECRLAGDTDTVINAKVRHALQADLTVILCIGETKRDGHGDYLAILKDQLESALVGVKKTQFKDIVIAYEPVWAIGAQALGSDTPENFLHNALFIRKVISGLAGKEAAHAVKVLYGGSVTSKNAQRFLVEGQADGLLIGRASLDAKQFGDILAQ